MLLNPQRKISFLKPSTSFSEKTQAVWAADQSVGTVVRGSAVSEPQTNLMSFAPSAKVKLQIMSNEP
jgi:hypothetical protein